jgi:iron complex transport system permease protein
MVLLRVAISPDGLELPRPGTGEWGLRLQRTWSGLIVGSALGAAGVLLQSLLRNPLASPDLIGPSSGATLAVTIATYLHGASSSPSPIATAPAALIGSLSILALVYFLSQRRGFVDPVSLVLIGVIVSIICGAAAMFISHLMPPSQSLVASRWTIGTLSDDTSTPALIAATAAALLIIAVGAALGPAMDVASLSEDEARASGVNLSWLRISLFLGSGALAAAAVVLAGPIGFIGLVSPHAVRLLAGPAHRPLVIGAALAGAALIVGADAGTRAVRLETGRMPIGILTALVGGPVFIALLRTDPLRRGY